MLFYKFTAEFDKALISKEDMEKISDNQKQAILNDINRGIDNSEGAEKMHSYMGLTGIRDPNRPHLVSGLVCYDSSVLDKDGFSVRKDIAKSLKTIAAGSVKLKSVKEEEATVRDFMSVHNVESLLRFLRRSRRVGIVDYHEEYSNFATSERMVDTGKITSKKKADEFKSTLLPSRSLSDEVKRIFARSHPRDGFYGIPVHYKISACNDIVADRIVDFMVQCLYKNKRIVSSRVNKIYNIEQENDRDDFTGFIKTARGSVVEIVLTGDVATSDEYASRYTRISEILQELIKKASKDTLFFLVENVRHPGFAKQLVNRLADGMDIINIDEGKGNAKEADHLFRAIVKGSRYEQYAEGVMLFEEGELYTASEVMSAYNKWRGTVLKDKVYKAYTTDVPVLTAERETVGNAYGELMSMIGLTEVKGIIDSIIASCKVQMIRGEKRFDPYERRGKDRVRDSREISRHMVFTGSPGTAKTTVARLLAKVLKDNGVLGSGAFIECGRNDLVAKYVGWTARQVQDKFEEARGGILFIDEAYSLVDDRDGMFGDEAINTIVQQMENRRNSMVVIFAGYPDKMEGFLDKNPGLRSRIAFHVPFSDYSVDELMDITAHIAKGKGLRVSSSAMDKFSCIYKNALGSKDFGNGRFVRSLIEKTEMNMAGRLLALDPERITTDELTIITSDDVDSPEERQEKTERRIGF